VPWKASSPVEQKFQFVMECKKGEASMTALCRTFGISRQTGYKWLARYYEDGPAGCPAALEDRPRRAMRHPNEVGSGVTQAILWLRRKYPHWGPKKLQAELKKLKPDVRWPAVSTVGAVLERHGLVRPRRRRRHTPPCTQPFAAVTAPNQLWCVDFKGHFCTADGQRVYPLTITDAHSRFILRCEIVDDPDGACVREVFESAFREFGLPDAIRSDNGTPFASTGIAGLSQLSVWWVRLGIRLERIEPGKPQQNSRHERMHLTLKQQTASPPAANPSRQQRAFYAFAREFNYERPHEGLGMKTPAEVYVSSMRQFPDRTPELYSYQDRFDYQLLEVDKLGFVIWQRRRVFVSLALRFERIAFDPVGPRQWQVSFGPIVLGLFDETRKDKGIIRPKAR
jgi:transposase InsO family protein